MSSSSSSSRSLSGEHRDVSSHYATLTHPDTTTLVNFRQALLAQVPCNANGSVSLPKETRSPSSLSARTPRTLPRSTLRLAS